jgi:altronate dehydratase small subunit
MSEAAIVVDEKDNVATALRPLEEGELLHVHVGSIALDVTVSQPIPFGHKIALIALEKDQPVVKYGEVIGLATQRIGKGEHTHVHNVEGQTGRGDRT